MSTTDTALFERWTATRDADAFAELVARHSAMVYGTCKRVLGNSADAEDVAQECFIELARARAAIRRSLGGWLHTTAVHRSLDRIKAERRRKRRELQFVEQNGIQTEVAWDDIQTYIDEAIAALPDTLREPVVYRFLEGRTHEETARDLGVSVSTVRYRIRKALDRIRSFLKKRGIVVATSVLATMMGAHVAEAAPATLTAALGKLAIATSVGRTATAASPLAVAGGTVIMAKKVLIGLGAVAVLLLLGYSVSDRKGTETVEQPSEVALAPVEPSGIEPLTVDETPPPPVDEPPPVNATVLPEETQPVAEDIPIQLASVSGTVTEDEGHPFSGATIDLHVTSDPWGMYTKKAFSAVSGPDGKYKIAKIDMFGNAHVSASARGYVMPRPFGERLDLSPGEAHDGIDFTLQPGASSVKGRVISEQHEPLPDATVNLIHFGYTEDMRFGTGSGTISNMGRLMFVLTDENGRFEITIPEEGLCDFMVTKENHGTGFFPMVSTGTDDALFVLRSPGVIAGRVVWASGEPVQGASIEVFGETYRGGLKLPETRGRYRLSPMTVRADQHGDYTVDGLSEDYMYVVAAHDPSVGSRKQDMMQAMQHMLRFSRSETGPHIRRNVRVSTGKTTYGVDLVLSPSALLYGKITAEDGSPVYPLGVIAQPEDSDEDYNLVRTRVEPDGSYSLTLEISEPTEFEIGTEYVHIGGTDESSREEPLTVHIEPGEQKQFDFAVKAPVRVPVRYIDTDGELRNDVYAAIRRVGGDSTSRGSEEVDSQGRILLEGLPSGQLLQALGRTERDIVGVSEPFMGKPGETLPEITVVCPWYGGIEGILIDGEGNPLADSEFMCIGVLTDGTLSQIRSEDTNADGQLKELNVLPEGEYSQVYVAYRHDENLRLAVIDNVEIVRDSVTTLGEIAGEPVSEERGQELFGEFIQFLR